MDQKKLLELVKQIREETGLGVMDIKNALEKAEGDIQKAKDALREKGLSAAAKRADRETRQGLVAVYTHFTGKMAAMVELLCETDFVAKGEDFVKLSKDLASHVAAMEPATTEELLEQDYVKDPSKKVKDLVNELIAKVGENVRVGRITRFSI